MGRMFSGWLRRRLWHTPIPWRRVVVTVVGVTTLLVGVAMIVLPGPATLVIPTGLAILAREYHWARRLIVRLRVAWRGCRARRSRGKGQRARLEFGER